MIQMKPVTRPADGGEEAIPYCWSWLLDFLFLAPPRARCIMRCGRELSGLPSDRREATITKWFRRWPTLERSATNCPAPPKRVKLAIVKVEPALK